MNKLFSYVFVAILFGNICSVAACDCATPSPNMDEEVLSGIDVVGRFIVVDHKIPDWGGSAPYYNVYTLGVEQLYRGEILVNTDSNIVNIQAISDGANGCARYIEVGKSYDLLLLRMDSGYTLTGQCTELSDEMWDALKK